MEAIDDAISYWNSYQKSIAAGTPDQGMLCNAAECLQLWCPCGDQREWVLDAVAAEIARLGKCTKKVDGGWYEITTGPSGLVAGKPAFERLWFKAKTNS